MCILLIMNLIISGYLIIYHIENSIKFNKKVNHLGQNNLSQVGHLIKFDKIKWHVWLKWPMDFNQMWYPYMLVNKLNWLIITVVKQVA
jgi:hypothetical protein